jgi:FtsH-binding integral membrane protein
MTNLFTRNIEWDALGKTATLSPVVRQHLTKVYSTLAASLLVAAAGSIFEIATHAFAGFMSLIALIGLIVWFAITEPAQISKRLGLLFGIAFLQGVMIAPLVQNTLAIDPTIVSTAFLGTTCVFACFSGFALFSERRSYLYVGGMLSSGLSVLLTLSIANFFFRSMVMFNIQLYLGLLVFCGFVVFDTQLIVEKAIQGDKDFVGHSLELFIDFTKIFVRLLIILSKDKKSKKSSR